MWINLWILWKENFTFSHWAYAHRAFFCFGFIHKTNLIYKIIQNAAEYRRFGSKQFFFFFGIHRGTFRNVHEWMKIWMNFCQNIAKFHFHMFYNRKCYCQNPQLPENWIEKRFLQSVTNSKLNKKSSKKENNFGKQIHENYVVGKSVTPLESVWN